jgi:hypothetical protein
MDPYRSPAAKVTHVRCGYGGTGLSPVGYCAVMPYFDVAATIRITGLRMTEFTVEDIARANASIELRIWLPGRDRDHNEITKPFDGAIDAGVTLRLRATTVLTPVPPTVDIFRRRYRATLIADDAVTLELSGALDAPWPTA